jgi:hypothetical protein
MAVIFTMWILYIITLAIDKRMSLIPFAVFKFGLFILKLINDIKTMNYRSFINWINLFEILLLNFLVIYIFNQDPVTQSYLAFFSVFSVINYMRAVPSLGGLIELLRAVKNDMLSFVAVLLSAMIAFAWAFYVID